MKIRRLLTCLLLSVSTAMGVCMSGCSKSSGSDNKTLVIVEEETNLEHYVEGTLHNVNVNYNSPVSEFVTNGHTEYKVVVGNTYCSRMSGVLVEHVNKATNGNLQTIEISELATDTVTTDTKYIFVGCESLYAIKGGTMPTYDEIGVSGYQVVTYGKNVFINAYSVHGYQMGVIAFLNAVIGYDMLAEDCVLYERDGKEMPTMDIVERPDFDYRRPNTKTLSNEEILGMGYTYEDPIISGDSSWPHNWHDFVSKEEADENPDWASSDEDHWQGCWTARGNKESYTGLINHLTEKVKGFLIANPTKDSIMIGQHDVGTYTPSVEKCSCTSCSASYEYYGTMAGAWLSLCNRVSVKVDEWLETEEAIEIFGGVKDWNLIALVYHASMNPPVEKEDGLYVWDENGHGIPKVEKWFNGDGTMEDWEEAWTDENGDSMEEDVIKEWSDTHERIYSAKNVHFMFAASSASYAHSYYEEENSAYKTLADGWAGVGGDFYVWLYSFNSRAILYPTHTFDTCFETTRYFKSMGAKWIYWQTQYQNENNPGFNKLKNYLYSKVQFDVNSDYQFYVDKFFKHYYGVAGEYMQDYFNQLNAHCRWVEQENFVTTVHTNTKITDAQNWPEGLMYSWRSLIQQAFDAIEIEYKQVAPEKYEIYRKHVLTEDLFPTYVLCTTYADSFGSDQLKQMRLQFIEDFYALGNKYYWELGLMTEVTDAWDLD